MKKKEYRKEIKHLKRLLDQEMADHEACRKALQHVNWQFNNRLKAEVAAGWRDGKTLEWNYITGEYNYDPGAEHDE